MMGTAKALFVGVVLLFELGMAQTESPTPPAGAVCKDDASILASAASFSWKAEPDRLADHVALRKRAAQPLPAEASRILLYQHYSHMMREDMSRVATRGADGRWTVDTVDEEQFIGPAKPGVHTRVMLSVEDSAALDDILSDRCLYAAPTDALFMDFPAGDNRSTVAIETPQHHWTAGWTGNATTTRLARIRQLLSSR
ncbi:MAG: hypothetical protein PGN08_12230 [Sphingomonas taxi]